MRMMQFCGWLFTVLAVVLSGSLQAQAPPVSPGVPTVLQPGDHIVIEVWNRPELSGDFLVAADSSISHPLYQDVRVVGISFAEASQRVRDFLYSSGESNPRVRVEPLLRVSIVGEVRSPGMHVFGPETTISQAVVLAGGTTERGSVKKIRLRRGGQEWQFDLRDMDSSVARMPIRSGDQIEVPRNREIMRRIVAPTVTGIHTILSVLYMYDRFVRN